MSHGVIAMYRWKANEIQRSKSDVPYDVQRCPMELVATSMTKTSIDWASIARELRQQQTLKEQLASKNRNRKNKRHIWLPSWCHVFHTLYNLYYDKLTLENMKTHSSFKISITFHCRPQVYCMDFAFQEKIKTLLNLIKNKMRPGSSLCASSWRNTNMYFII